MTTDAGAQSTAAKPETARTPERRCIACGTRGPQAAFIRFHLAERDGTAAVVADGDGVRSGRGAYLCPMRACLDKALRKRAFARAFRRTVGVCDEDLLAAVMRAAGETGHMAGEVWRSGASTK